MKLIFYMQINIRVSYKFISTLWASKFPTRWYYHHWWAWPSILKVLKVASLQYLYNISKKKLGMEFIFFMPINVKVSASRLYRFWWKWPDMSEAPKTGNWWYFCNVLRKKCWSCFCILLWWKTFRYFTRAQSSSLLLVISISFWIITVCVINNFQTSCSVCNACDMFLGFTT